ncbi:Partitioning defective 3-like protein [Dinothrombium tinctorium]|uniref:Partitioning defective 3-like protein n=1 Tax=Dinothrombium tinctorium TaxID=1965070 RepID=A0A3S3PFT2_9ACAR|nr:Partitioning defective 3-like protein [Dinothrombium tinctorium]
MKVIVNFNAVRIIVPCTHEEMLVKDLIIEATNRYKKATAKVMQCEQLVHYMNMHREEEKLMKNARLVCAPLSEEILFFVRLYCFEMIYEKAR